MAAAMKTLGVASGIGTIAVCARAAREWFHSRVLTFAAALLVSASPFFALWAADGLETVFFAFLITLLLWLTVRGATSPWRLGLLAALVALTRPEGALFGMATVAFLATRSRFDHALRVSVPLLIGLAGYEAFRLVYFGEWVPNTALLKVKNVGLPTIQAAFRYVTAFTWDSAFLLTPLAVIGAMRLRHRHIQLAVLFLLAQAVFLFVAGDDFMFGYRFIMPVFPVLALLACGALAGMIRNERALLVASMAIAATLCLSQWRSVPPSHIGADNLSRRASVHFAMADYLKPRTTRSDAVLISEAGIVPFHLDAKAVDYLGLASARRAVRHPDGSVNVDYLLADRPKYVVLSFVKDAAGVSRPRLREDSAIFTSVSFTNQYRPVMRFAIERGASLLNDLYYHHEPAAQLIYFEVFELGGRG
jgi:hypothetical protein